MPAIIALIRPYHPVWCWIKGRRFWEPPLLPFEAAQAELVEVDQ